jgi:hypothetical protein
MYGSRGQIHQAFINTLPLNRRYIISALRVIINNIVHYKELVAKELNSVWNWQSLLLRWTKNESVLCMNM